MSLTTAAQRRRPGLAWPAWLVAVALVGAAGALYTARRSLTLVEHGRVAPWDIGWLGHEFLRALLYVFATPTFPIGLLVVFLLQRYRPARPDEPMVGPAVLQDVVWTVLGFLLQLVFLTGYVAFLTGLHEDHFDFLTLDVVTRWPWWTRFAWGVLVIDFLRWLQHYLQHRVPTFWTFHAIHHSQPHLNLFTDFRYHPVEYLVRHTVQIIPFLVVAAGAPAITTFNLFLVWQARIYHSNVRTNFGVLRYLVVTPQSHRVHHSIEPQHHDRNFGAFLCVWDRMFRTHHLGEDDYPETGLPATTPVAPARQGPLATPLRQLVQPFVTISRSRRLGRTPPR